METKERKLILMEFGNRLTILMSERKVSINELVREIAVDKRTLLHWIEGKSLPKITYVISLAKFFKVKSDYLVGLIDTKK